MNFDLRLSIEILERTPAILRAMLAGLSDAWVHNNYGEDTFSPFDIVGHLIYGEREDWLVRARIILDEGESRPFDRYDRYAQFEESRGASLPELLDTFEGLRRQNLETLKSLNLSVEALARRGRHPALGPVTLENLLATWVAHDLNHVSQIAKCMATQYADAVGPWIEYLSILRTPVTKMNADGPARRRAAMGG